VFALPGSSRNFWWSSSKSSAPEQAVSAQTESAATVDSQPVASSVPEQPPAEVAQLVESTNALDAAPVSGTLPLSDVASDAVTASTSNSLIDTVAQLPLQYGDLAALGLTGWGPAGLCRSFIEVFHVATGMPWFWTIVGTTVIARLVIFPFTVKSIRNAARMAPHQAEFDKLRAEINAARLSKDSAQMQRAVIKQQLMYKKIGVSVGGMMLPPLMQIPVTLGMFFGIKKMCDLPVEQLKWSGVSFWPDLTVPDPTYILPIVTTAIMNLSLTVCLVFIALLGTC
jgi:YidC/Oxa1 family membrane protein insertase